MLTQMTWSRWNAIKQPVNIPRVIELLHAMFELFESILLLLCFASFKTGLFLLNCKPESKTNEPIYLRQFIWDLHFRHCNLQLPLTFRTIKRSRTRCHVLPISQRTQADYPRLADAVAIWNRTGISAIFDSPTPNAATLLSLAFAVSWRLFVFHGRSSVLFAAKSPTTTQIK